jgi:hypothetical protein
MDTVSIPRASGTKVSTSKQKMNFEALTFGSSHSESITAARKRSLSRADRKRGGSCVAAYGTIVRCRVCLAANSSTASLARAVEYVWGVAAIGHASPAVSEVLKRLMEQGKIR